MTQITDQRIEYFDKGVQRYWYTSHIVVIATDGSSSPEAADQWFDVVLDTFNHYPPEFPSIFLLHDNSHPNQRVTPYSRQKAQELYYHVNMDRPIYVGVVLKPSIFNQLIAILTRIWNLSYPNVHQKNFKEKEDALRWLQEMVTAYG